MYPLHSKYSLSDNSEKKEKSEQRHRIIPQIMNNSEKKARILQLNSQLWDRSLNS